MIPVPEEEFDVDRDCVVISALLSESTTPSPMVPFAPATGGPGAGAVSASALALFAFRALSSASSLALNIPLTSRIS